MPNRAPSRVSAPIVRGAPGSIALALRAAEFTVLYAGVPMLFIHRAVSPGMLIPFLLGTGGLLTLILLLDPTFDNARFGRASSLRRHWGWMWRVFLVGAAGLAALTLLIRPDAFLGFPRNNFPVYAIIMVAYPVFSVYPQEIIFRTFLFHRYAMLFRHPAAMIGASALAFGWGHVFFDANLWVTIGLSTIGGALFAWTYHKTKSTFTCAIEHALYGDFIFTVGLGWYFYTGSIGG